MSQPVVSSRLVYFLTRARKKKIKKEKLEDPGFYSATIVIVKSVACNS